MLAYQPPAAQGHHRPDRFDQTERPRALQEAIGRGQNAGAGEAENEQSITLLEGVADDHRRDREQAKNAERIHVRIMPELVGVCAREVLPSRYAEPR